MYDIRRGILGLLLTVNVLTLAQGQTTCSEFMRGNMPGSILVEACYPISVSKQATFYNLDIRLTNQTDTLVTAVLVRSFFSLNVEDEQGISMYHRPSMFLNTTMLPKEEQDAYHALKNLHYFRGWQLDRDMNLDENTRNTLHLEPGKPYTIKLLLRPFEPRGTQNYRELFAEQMKAPPPDIRPGTYNVEMGLAIHVDNKERSWGTSFEIEVE